MTGTEIKEWRAARNLTREELAARLPINERTLEGLEQGRFTPPPYFQRALQDLDRELKSRKRKDG